MFQLIPRFELTGHAGAIYDLTGKGNFVYSASGDHFVARWDLKNQKQDTFSIRASDAIYSIALLNDEKHLIFGTSKGAVHLIDLLDKKEIKCIEFHKVALFSITENPTKKQIYLGDAAGNLSVWNSETWNLLVSIPFDCGKIRSIRVDETNNLLFVSCQDGKTRILDIDTFNEIQALNGHETGVNCGAIFPLKKDFFASGGKDGYVRIWNWKQGKQLLEIPAHNFGIYQIEFLNNGQNMITISRDKSIKLWDANELKVIQKIERKHKGHSHAVNAIYKINEFEFVSAGDDKRIIYWDLVER